MEKLSKHSEMLSEIRTENRTLDLLRTLKIFEYMTTFLKFVDCSFAINY